LVRRSLVPEPELNPYPLLAWPAVFTFLQASFSLGILALIMLLLLPRSALSNVSLPG